MKFIIIMMMIGQSYAFQIKVMSYNVQNLFDAKKDFGKDDWTFLPLGTPGKTLRCQAIRRLHWRNECLEMDWTEEKLEMKLNQIAKVIDLEKPDLLGLVEIENENVVSKLAKKSRYKKWIVTNSMDKRGVDVALIYNEKQGFKFQEAREHYVGLTRAILEARFIIAQKHLLVIFLNHWPSQRVSTHKRIVISEYLRDSILELPKKAFVLVMGDFNTIDSEKPHPIKDILTSSKLLYDIDIFARRFNKSLAPGTYFYPPKMQWNLLDRFLVNRRLKRKGILWVDLSSYRIVAPPFLRESYRYSRKGHLYGSKVVGVPQRYRFGKDSNLGFSDHFPISIMLRAY